MKPTADDITYTIFPLGVGALTVEFGQQISIHHHELVSGLHDQLTAEPFVGLSELVIAYSSLTVFYDLGLVAANTSPTGPTAFETVRRHIKATIDAGLQAVKVSGQTHEIPVDFSSEAGPDLDFVAAHSGLTRESVIDVFTSTEYRVFMLGFLPGFAYMGELDARLSMPRRQTPRLAVPAGSVGLAGRQTGIYPLNSPGGWQIIGRTPLSVFSVSGDQPCLFRSGDHVRFFDSAR